MHLFLIFKDRCREHSKTFRRLSCQLERHLCPLKGIADDLVRCISAIVHRASPPFSLSFFAPLIRIKRSTPGTNANVRPLSHRMCSWPASSTNRTVPFVPAGTGDSGSSMLCSSMRLPAGYCILMSSTISLPGILPSLSSINTFFIFIFHVSLPFCFGLRQPLIDFY